MNGDKDTKNTHLSMSMKNRDENRNVSRKDLSPNRNGNIIKLIATFTAGILTASFFFSAQGSLYNTASDIPRVLVQQRTTIEGTVLKVIDGDTMRVRHLPNPFSSSSFSGNLKDRTILVRLAAIDAPEIAKGSNGGSQGGQPFSEEAKSFVSKRLQGKKVKVKCLAKDQYGRLVGKVMYRDGGGAFMGLNIGSVIEKDIGAELVQEGLAAVYRQSGASYGEEGLQYWNDLEQTAKLKKKGIWSSDNVELPSEFKKKSKQERARREVEKESKKHSRDKFKSTVKTWGKGQMKKREEQVISS